MAEHSLHPSSIIEYAKRRPARSETSDLAVHEMGALADIIATQSEIARAGLDLNRVVDVITHKSQALTGSTGAVVEMVDGDDLIYWSGSGSVAGHVGLRIPHANSLSGLCVERGELLRCQDSETDPRVNLDACRRVGLRSALITPLMCDGVLVGVLKVLSNQPNAYSRQHMEVLRSLATFMGATLHSALEHAGTLQAMRQIKEADASANEQSEHERRLLSELIRARRITPVFQPIVELASGKVVGYEGLSRFPKDVPPPADGWFDAANRLGMGIELEMACIEAIAEAVRHSKDIQGYISVNLSPESLVRLDFDKMPPCPMPAGWVIEITEHSEVRDYEALARRVSALQDKGVKIAIDDVGAGYASLRHVLRLSPDLVKLDISLTRDIDSNLKHRQLAAAVVSFARDAGITLVAEGVETQGERDALIGLGVACGQGYLIGRPAPIDEVA